MRRDFVRRFPDRVDGVRRLHGREGDGGEARGRVRLREPAQGLHGGHGGREGPGEAGAMRHGLEDTRSLHSLRHPQIAVKMKRFNDLP